MKRLYSLRWLFVFLLLASLPALACGLIGGGDEEAPEQAEDAPVLAEDAPVMAEDAPVMEEPGEEPEFPVLGDMNRNLEGLDSYRLDMLLTFEGTDNAEAHNGSMRFRTAEVAEPRALEIVMTLEGNLPEEMLGADTITFVEIDGQSYTIFPGFGCLTSPADEMGGTADDFGAMIQTDDILGDLQDAEYLGRETVNGVATFHYRFDESHVRQQEEGLDDVEGHVYIAQELGYVVRMVFDGTGEMDLFDTGEVEKSNIHMEYNVTDVNVPLLIEPPADCANAGGEFPVMPGATELASMMGFTSYQVEAAFDEVIAFYDAEMSALGYQADEDPMIFEDVAMLGYSQDGSRVNVTVTEEAGVISVLITSQSDEE